MNKEISLYNSRYESQFDNSGRSYRKTIIKESTLNHIVWAIATAGTVLGGSIPALVFGNPWLLAFGVLGLGLAGMAADIYIPRAKTAKAIMRSAEELGVKLTKEQQKMFRKNDISEYGSKAKGFQIEVESKNDLIIQFRTFPAAELDDAFFSALTMKGKTLDQTISKDRLVANDLFMGTNRRVEVFRHISSLNRKMEEAKGKGFLLEMREEGVAFTGNFNSWNLSAVEGLYRKDFAERLKFKERINAEI